VIKNMEKIGSFKILSSKVIISDPCYDIGSIGMIEKKNIKKGDWVAYKGLVEGESKIISDLYAVHKDFLTTYINWEYDLEDIRYIYVDSGQAGIFDISHFKDSSVVNEKADFIPEEPWYSMCANRTLRKERAGVIPYGVVAASGFGDGIYDVYFGYDNKANIVSINICFVDLENEY